MADEGVRARCEQLTFACLLFDRCDPAFGLALASEDAANASLARVAHVAWVVPAEARIGLARVRAT